jgi:hypothetical protein
VDREQQPPFEFRPEPCAAAGGPEDLGRPVRAAFAAGKLVAGDRRGRVRAAAEFDDESIGLLAVPPPTLGDLAAALLGPYSFLGAPDALELEIVAGGAAARSLVISQIRSLPGGRFESRELW